MIRQYTAADAAAKYEAYRRAGHPLTPEQVVDELVAEYAGRHLREEGAIRRLAGENRRLAEWVRGSIRALAERIREKLGRAEPTLEHAQRLWERAFRAAEQHASRQNPSVPLPGPETPARYSIREEIDSSHSGEYTGEATGRGEVDARKWYLEHEAQIPDLIDKSLPLEEQAKQAFSLRNQFRTQARELMEDRVLAESLYKSDPNLTWEQLIEKQRNKGYSGDDIYKAIIESSQRSRKSVNQSLGLDKE